MQVLKTNLILVSRVSRASTRLHVFDFSLDRDDVDLFFFTGGCDYFGYVGRQSLITVLFHSMSCPRKCLEEMRNDTSILYDYLPVSNL